MITVKNTLAEVVRDYPQTIPFFNELHLDYCCGGGIPLEEAVKGTDLDANKIAADLNDYIAEHNAKPGSQNDSLEHFKSLSIPDMLSDLEATHHVVERKLWAEIDTDLNKILLVHYAHHGVMLTKLHHLFGLLRTDLEEHFAREEKLVFPLMRTYSRPNLEILTLVQNLEADHSAAGDIIKEIEALTDHFTVPADACATFKRTYQLLEEFVNDVFVHIFKENSIVFPEYAEKAPSQESLDRQVEVSLENEAGRNSNSCGYCESAEGEEEKSPVLYECGNCGALYCNDCGETGCPSCGASFSHAHPIEYSGSSWNPNQD